MNTYRLKFTDNAARGAQEIEFEARNGVRALAIAQEQAGDRSAELWFDGRLACLISPAPGGFWHVAPAPGDRRSAAVSR